MSGVIFSSSWKGFLFCQRTQSAQAEVWVSGRLHLPAPLWVASLGSWPVTDNMGAPRRRSKVVNVWSWPRWADLYSIQHDFVQFEWKLRQRFRRSCRTWPCWKIITRVCGFGCQSWGQDSSSRILVFLRALCQCVLPCWNLEARRVEKKTQCNSWKALSLGTDVDVFNLPMVKQLWLAHAVLTTSITCPFSVCNLHIV